MAMEIWNFEARVEISFWEDSDESVSFIVEIYRSIDINSYKIRLFRSESFRVEPSFGEYPEGGADHTFYVADLLLDGKKIKAASADEALQFALDSLKRQGFA